MELYEYIIRRFCFAVPVLLVISLFVFAILYLAPGDPVYSLVSERMGEEALALKRHELGLDRPLYVQYLDFLKATFTGTIYSYYRKKPVFTLFGERLPNTLTLTVLALVVSYLVAIPTGIFAAVHRGTLGDSLSMVFALVGLAIPQFWLGLMLIIVFAGKLKWFPVSGYGNARSLVLPVISLGMYGAALAARVTRSSMLEVLQKDYITTARAKGLRERIVIYKHALRNALIPLIAVLGLRVGWLVGGAVVIETVFNRPGIGRLLVNSVYQKDYPVAQVLILILAAAVILGNIIADMLCAITDPRVRYT